MPSDNNCAITVDGQPRVDNSSVDRVRMEQLKTENATLREENAELTIEIAHLRAELAKLRAEWNPRK